MPIPRASLATLVCPSTPFLAPRLLCSPASLAALRTVCGTGSASVQRPTYATKAKQSKQSKQSRPVVRKVKTYLSPKTTLIIEQSPLLEKFTAACNARSITTMMDLYPTVITSPLLSRNDTGRVAQSIHTYLRWSPKEYETVRPFLERVVQDIRSGRLPPHPHANRHILSIYKEHKKFHEGIAFWQWLSERDDAFVDPAVYGAAIELLAYGGNISLEILEDLYSEALKRFPGTFAEYHLSPDAIVPDRTQPLAISGIPITLLQGILTARLLARDWKNAYLAFDTALRLHPSDLPPRFFELFMTERPLAEGYTVFLMACRSGIVFKPNHLTVIISRLRQAMVNSKSLQDRMGLLRAMSNAIYAYMESGGMVEGPHIGAFLNAFNHLLPVRPQGHIFDDSETKIKNLIVTSAHSIASSLIQAGMPPHVQVFTALISLAGRLGVPDLLSVTLNDVETARLDLGPIGRRITLIVAGDVQDKDLVERYWNQIAAVAENESQPITRVDWLTLARVCRRASCQNFFDDQVQALKHAINSATEVAARKELETEQRSVPDQSLDMMNVDEFSAEITVVLQHMKNVAAVIMSGAPLDLRKTPFSMFLDPARLALGTTTDLRDVYEELTTDPHQPPPPPESTATALSSTSIPLGELRFQNWVSILELMAEAQVSETYFQRRVTEAISQGRPLNTIHEPLTFNRNVQSSSGEAPHEQSLHSKTELRTRIKQLRAPHEPSSATDNRFIGLRNLSNSAKGQQVRFTPSRNGETEDAFGPTDAVFTGRPTLRHFTTLRSYHTAPKANKFNQRPLQIAS